MNRLDPILASTREAVARRREVVSLAELDRAGSARVAAGDMRPFLAALAAPGLSVIAEHKRRSPSAGVIREGISLEQVVVSYERAGASALSILTDGPSFGGSLDDLRAARIAASLPILRKDFIVDPYQLHESLAGGADAILLIVAALDQQRLVELHGLSGELGLTALVEVHDRDELARALDAGAEVIGINNRDLTTLQVDTRRTDELLALVPAGTVTVSESGLRRREQLEALAAAGVHAVLIGEALMRAPDIESACRELTTAFS